MNGNTDPCMVLNVNLRRCSHFVCKYRTANIRRVYVKTRSKAWSLEFAFSKSTTFSCVFVLFLKINICKPSKFRLWYFIFTNKLQRLAALTWRTTWRWSFKITWVTRQYVSSPRINLGTPCRGIVSFTSWQLYPKQNGQNAYYRSLGGLQNRSGQGREHRWAEESLQLFWNLILTLRMSRQ